MKITIRKAQKIDIDRICELEKITFPDDPWPRFIFEEVLEHPKQSFYAATTDDSVVGYIIFWKILDEVHILNLCVAKEKRHKGIGKKLFNYCLSCFPKGEVISYSLEVRKSNTIAQEFYKKLGFKEAFVRKNYYKNHEDAIIMTFKIL